jgi:hypothetical protein
MTLDCHVAHRVLRKPPTTPSNPIWISDTFLAEPIQRFTCVHRRYGSSVPGPLEARRRATRRKNTSLASVGSGGPPIEAGALFGNGRKVEWWNNPASSEQPEGQVEREFLTLCLCCYILMKHSSFNTAFLAH